MTEKQELVEIDLRRAILVLWNRAWIIALVGILCAAMFFSYAYFFVSPQYSANIKLYVNNTYGTNTPGVTASQLAAAQGLAYTYMVILESRTVMNEVAEITDLPYTYDELKSMITSGSVSDTEIFETTITCADYKHAAQIANAIARVLPDKIAAVVEGSSVRVVDYAVESSTRVSPSYQNYALTGLAIGVLLSAVVILAMDLLDNSIGSEEYLIQAYDELPLLAVIPDAEDPKTYGYHKGYYKGYYESTNKPQSSQKTGGEK